MVSVATGTVVAEDETAATEDRGDSVTTGSVDNVVETASTEDRGYPVTTGTYADEEETAPTEDVEDCTAAGRLADERGAAMAEVVLGPVLASEELVAAAAADEDARAPGSSRHRGAGALRRSAQVCRSPYPKEYSHRRG